MPPELTVLGLAALLQVAQLTMYSIAGQAQAGTKAALKPRDEQIELTGKPGRIHRALNNHFEGLILFGIAAVLAAHAGPSAFTAACAWIYLVARVIYIPAYVFGWVPWRSFIWLTGLAATTLMILAALL